MIAMNEYEPPGGDPPARMDIKDINAAIEWLARWPERNEDETFEGHPWDDVWCAVFYHDDLGEISARVLRLLRHVYGAEHFEEDSVPGDCVMTAVLAGYEAGISAVLTLLGVPANLISSDEEDGVPEILDQKDAAALLRLIRTHCPDFTP